MAMFKNHDLEYITEVYGKLQTRVYEVLEANTELWDGKISADRFGALNRELLSVSVSGDQVSVTHSLPGEDFATSFPVELI